MPNNSGIDSQVSYFRTKLHSIINNLFYSLSLPYNLKLQQSLLVEKQHKFKNSLKYINIEEEIATLKGKKNINSITHRKELYIQKRKLTTKELYKQQKVQLYRLDIDNKDNTLLYYYRTIFNRTRFLIPKQDHLTSVLFKVITL